MAADSYCVTFLYYDSTSYILILSPELWALCGELGWDYDALYARLYNEETGLPVPGAVQVFTKAKARAWCQQNGTNIRDTTVVLVPH